MIRERGIQKKIGRGIGKDIIIIHVVYIHTEGRREGGREQNMQHTHQHAHPSHLHNCEDVYVNAHICSIKHTHTHTHTHTHERLTTHIAVGPSVVRAGDLLVCRPSSYCRLFRLGWREEEEGEYRRNERGREKCASLNTLRLLLNAGTNFSEFSGDQKNR